MSDQMDFQGEIAARSKDGGGIKIGETWYNTWAKDVTFPDSWKAGAKVRFLYTKNGRYNNIVEGKVKLLAPSQGQPSGGGGGGSGGGSRSNAGPEIMAQNALTNAVTLVNGMSHIFENMTLGAIAKTTATLQAYFADMTRRISKGEKIPEAMPAFGGEAPAPASSGGDDWGQAGSAPAAQNAGQGAPADWDDDLPF